VTLKNQHGVGWTMIITKIETFPVRIPFEGGGSSAAAAWGDKNLPAADSLLVKVTTDQGLEGWGEAFGFRTVMSAKLAIDELIAPLCIGQEAGRIASLMLDVQKKLHVFGRGGSLAYGSRRSTSRFGISQAKWPICRFAGFSAAVVQI
jgi:L-alanine-DL-glutamate epimerase-like enolase superfamily enzyme